MVIQRPPQPGGGIALPPVVCNEVTLEDTFQAMRYVQVVDQSLSTSLSALCEAINDFFPTQR